MLIIKILKFLFEHWGVTIGRIGHSFFLRRLSEKAVTPTQSFFLLEK
jgi:hypothetical protein